MSNAVGTFKQKRDFKYSFLLNLRRVNGGMKIRKLLSEGRKGISPEEELEWFVNDRKEDVEINIQPALNAGKSGVDGSILFLHCVLSGSIRV